MALSLIQIQSKTKPKTAFFLRKFPSSISERDVWTVNLKTDHYYSLTGKFSWLQCLGNLYFTLYHYEILDRNSLEENCIFIQFLVVCLQCYKLSCDMTS